MPEPVLLEGFPVLKRSIYMHQCLFLKNKQTFRRLLGNDPLLIIMDMGVGNIQKDNCNTI